MTICRRKILAFSGFGLLLSAPALADVKGGVDAWTRGDYPSAVGQWTGPAASGDADAQFNLAQAYKLGRGVKQDLAKAEELFGKAADQGHIQASDNYGLLLFQRGERSKALPYLVAASGRGDPRAQYLLGIGHFNGDIVGKDWVRAYALVSLAQQAGLAQAGSALAQMDQHVPMAQRQQAVELASELRSQADATRARQMAAADLGATVPGNPAPVAAVATRSVSPANASDAASAASRAVADSPATAGADYTRPVGSRPALVRQAAPPAITAPAPSPAAAPAASAARSIPALTAAAPSAASGAWRIQLGAFGQPGNADALWNRLKGRPELAGRPRLNVKAGAVVKLQAGGFASQSAAQDACRRLAAIGQTCIAVRN